MKKYFIIISLLLSITMLYGQAPQLINYQGKLDSSGVPITGTRNLIFSIYSDTASLTAPMWTETRNNVTVTNGIFNVLLGSVTPFPVTLFTNPGERFIGVTVGTASEMKPRLKIASVAYSLRANQSDGVADNTITSAKVVDGTIALADIAAGAVGTSQIADNAVTSAKILDGAVVATDIASNAITTVKIADNNVTAAKIADEPGVVANQFNGGIVLNTTSMIDITTVSITIPSAGYIVLYGKCFFQFTGVTTQNTALVQIDETAGGTWTTPYYQYLGNDAYPNSTGYYRFAANLTRIYYKVAGTYTFRLEGEAYNAAPAEARVWYPMLHAIYIPTSYGTVNTILSSNDLGGFSNAVPVDPATISNPPSSSTTEPLYNVDLRELENKVKNSTSSENK
jgi:hypothetical protein